MSQEYNYVDFPPMIFSVDCIVLEDAGSVGRNQIAINDRPFILKYITHQIIAPYDDAESVQVNQDGMYRINWSLHQQRRYFQGTIPLADAAFGSVRHGNWIPLQTPIRLEGHKTINVDVENVLDRDKQIIVQVLFHGVEDNRKA